MSPLDEAFEEVVGFSPGLKPDVVEAMRLALATSLSGAAFGLLYVVGDCQSPIEQLFVAALWQGRGFNMVFRLSGDRAIRVPGWRDEMSSYGVVEVTPQEKVGIYSADFMIKVTSGLGSARVAVECDGHDFHERTRKQAQHDKKRDRFFASERLTVLRFTGSEITRDARGCVFEVMQQLRKEGA